MKFLESESGTVFQMTYYTLSYHTTHCLPDRLAYEFLKGGIVSDGTLKLFIFDTNPEV